MGHTLKLFLATAKKLASFYLFIYFNESLDSHVIACFLELGPLSKYEVSRDSC